MLLSNQQGYGRQQSREGTERDRILVRRYEQATCIVPTNAAEDKPACSDG